MKKNKTLAYMLAATLLVGGTFVGTKALFTDELNTVGDLAISTGDVDIEVVPNEGEISNEWKLNRNGAELSDGTNIGLTNDDSTTGTITEDDWNGITSSKKANNLKPGDVLTKTITVQNQGTLVAELDLTTNENIQSQLGVLSGLITATGTITDEDKKLYPGETTTIELTLTVENKGGKHSTSTNTTVTDNNYNTDGIEDHKIDLKNAWVLTATQQNGDDYTTALPNN